MSFDTALRRMEAVTQVTIAAQSAQEDLIFGIIVPNSRPGLAQDPVTPVTEGKYKTN
jgi:hypothetical protein